MLGVEPKYEENSDKKKVESINKAKALKKEKYGKEYCPCVPPKFHSDDVICPCKEYREHCHCHCGLYIA